MASSTELPWEAAGVHGIAGIQLLISQAPSPLGVTAVVLTQPEQRQHFPGLQPLIEAAAPGLLCDGSSCAPRSSLQPGQCSLHWVWGATAAGAVCAEIRLSAGWHGIAPCCGRLQVTGSPLWDSCAHAAASVRQAARDGTSSTIAHPSLRSKQNSVLPAPTLCWRWDV